MSIWKLMHFDLHVQLKNNLTLKEIFDYNFSIWNIQSFFPYKFILTVSKSDYTVNYVLIFSEEYRNSNTTHQSLFDDWTKEGGSLRTFPSLELFLIEDGYRGCLEKFYAFLLTDYDRVIAMDTDGFPNSNLDHLFWLPMPKGIELAAPQGYWFSNEGVRSDFCQLVGKEQNCK